MPDQDILDLFKFEDPYDIDSLKDKKGNRGREISQGRRIRTDSMNSLRAS